MNIYLVHRVPILLEELRYTIEDVFPEASINLYKCLEDVSSFSLSAKNILLIHMDNNDPKVLKTLKKLMKRDVKILVWVEASEKDTIINLIQQKFFGYLLNSFEMGELLQALKLFQQNKPYLQPNLSSLFLEVYINDKIQNKTLPNLILTKREWEVLQLLCTGASNEQVGNQLFLTESTVKNHVSSILSKLEVPDRTSAVVKAFKNRWVNI